MKIGHIGINDYRPTQRPEQLRPQTNVEQDKSVTQTITPQNPVQVSKVAIRTAESPGFAGLSPAERQALELVFAKYKDNPRFAPTGESQNTDLGRFVDVKV